MLPSQKDNGFRLAGIIQGLFLKLGFANEKDTITRIPAEADRAILVVIDGLGWNNIQACRGHCRTISSIPGGPIKTVAPSTTAAALTSLSTGCLPGEHGLLGYTQLHPEQGIISCLSDWEGIKDVREWQLSETLYERALANGLHSAFIGRRIHENSGFTHATLTGTEYFGADTMAEKFKQATELLYKSEHKFVYLYVDDLDRIGHSRGWQSQKWIEALEELDSLLAKLRDSMASSTILALTADHGMIDTDENDHLFLDDFFKDLDFGYQLGGEPRFRHLYAEPENLNEFLERLQKFDSQISVLTRREAIASNIFGNVTRDSIHDRIGNLILLPKEHFLIFENRDSSARNMVGHHGGFTDFETEIPFLTEML